jgi:D-beta-D-heptose 7-phosphate kinase/D-beta-D-heptose 1-phosphate adenosyltransferase
MDEESDKLLGRGDLRAFRAAHEHERIVFTNGCFDLIHRGHVALLRAAQEQGDLLVVGINSDDSVRRLKGSARPVMDETDRVLVLLALRYVDFVTVFDEDTPAETIRELMPDVLVKGAEYGTGEIVGEDFVTGRGGAVVRVEMLGTYSTSELIERIRRQE